MASSIPAMPKPRRAASLPVGRPVTSSSPDPQIEILFTMPSVRIIAFTASSNSTSRPSSSSGIIEDEPGTLSWVSRFERTLAVGPLRIYRAPGSVAFLNCANALRPILPKSQAWCVDGSSTFVLQIRPPDYWRIEVPSNTGDENRVLDELKKVLGQVLLYEKTPCPFQRDFEVILPAKPTTPVKKRPWRPVGRQHSDESPKSSPLASEDVHTPPSADTTIGSSYLTQRPISPPSPLQGSLLNVKKTIGESNLAVKELSTRIEAIEALNISMLETSMSEPESVSDCTEDQESVSDTTDDTNPTPKRILQAHQSSSEIHTEEKNSRPQSMQNYSRSVTAPPLLSLKTSPPSQSPRTQSPLRHATSFESNSDCSSSVESFHSTESWHSPLAPRSPSVSESFSPTSTYPYPHENIVLPKRPVHTRDASELTVTLETPRIWDMRASSARTTTRSLSPPPRTPPMVHDGSEKSDEENYEIATPPTVRPSIRHRATTSSNSRRRELSPLPAAVNLFSPPRRRQRHLRTSRHLPTAIIQKTCEILLSPPSHLFHLMISIASKIAAGEWRGVLSGHGEAVHWDFEDEYGSSALYEDDYGVKLAKAAPARAKTSGSSVPSNSWEVD